MFTIGQVAARAQVSTDSIRFYEREGLLAPENRTESGYRLYTEETVRRIDFIKHAQECGFTLTDIRELLDLRGADDSCCSDIQRIAVEKKQQIDSRIRALQAMSGALGGLIEACSGGRTPVDRCPILGALEASLSKVRTGRATPSRSAVEDSSRKAGPVQVESRSIHENKEDARTGRGAGRPPSPEQGRNHRR